MIHKSISIHALTRSATLALTKQFLRLDISIHPLTRRATFYTYQKLHSSKDFNPRTHEECDQKAVELVHSTDISIHALTRSATMSEHILRSQDYSFQSTHSRGVRPIVI